MSLLPCAFCLLHLPGWHFLPVAWLVCHTNYCLPGRPSRYTPLSSNEVKGDCHQCWPVWPVHPDCLQPLAEPTLQYYIYTQSGHSASIYTHLSMWYITQDVKSTPTTILQKMAFCFLIRSNSSKWPVALHHKITRYVWQMNTELAISPSISSISLLQFSLVFLVSRT